MASEREDPEDDLRKTMRIPASAKRGVDDDTPTLSRPVKAVQRPSSRRAPARDNGPSTALRTGESDGRPNAFYAPARPHVVPASRVPIEDPRAPAVIINDDVDEKTVPDMRAIAPPVHDTLPGVNEFDTTVPYANGAQGWPQRPAGPMAGRRPPSSLERTQILARPNVARGMRKTMVVSKRGPSSSDKLLAFVGVLILMMASGIAIIAWKRPQWLGIGRQAVQRSPSTPASTSSSGSEKASPGATPLLELD